MQTQNIEELAVNTIRTLSMDAVEAAKSGHPGTPMALAPVAYLLYNEFLPYDPATPAWPESGPIRPLLRPCLDAPLLDAPSGRRPATGAGRERFGSAGRLSGRHPQLSAA